MRTQMRIGWLVWGVLSPSLALAAECQIHLGFNSEPIPPYIERSVPSAGPQGTAFALVDLAAHQTHCRLVWQHLPTLRVLHATELGDVDAALLAFRHVQRIRLLDQHRRLSRGEAVDNLVATGSLNGLDRKFLVDSLKEARRLQFVVQKTFRLESL